MKNYKKRIADNILNDKLEEKGAVIIEGPKWCGKTTTALQVAKSVIRMDEPSKRDTNIQIAEIDPSKLLEGDTPRLIDEWQIAPKIWDAARYEVDTRGEEGQFILTGSAVPIDSDEIKHSGTGRFTWLTMRPMSLFESGESSGEVSLEEMFMRPEAISGKNDMDIVLFYKRFTISKKKILYFEMYEENGGRNFKFTAPSKTIINAEVMNKLD